MIIFAVIGLLNCISLIGVFGWRIIKKSYNDYTIQSDIKKQTETTLIMRNGETVVISGLTKEKLTNTNAGVPGLKNLPGAKYIFGHESKGDSMEEVLIFITPEILPTRQAAGLRPATGGPRPLTPSEAESRSVTPTPAAQAPAGSTGALRR